MQIYVGITDYSWFQFLKERKSDEVKFLEARKSAL